jgi:hypothetical protein
LKGANRVKKKKMLGQCSIRDSNNRNSKFPDSMLSNKSEILNKQLRGQDLDLHERFNDLRNHVTFIWTLRELSSVVIVFKMKVL